MRLSAEQIAFLDAARQGDEKRFRMLLGGGVDVNTRDARSVPRGRTALMHAAEQGHPAVVEVLLRAGAKLDLKDRGYGVALPGGNTALLLALKAKQIRIARLLLEAGAGTRATSGGITALGQAASLGNAGLVRQILKAGANPNPPRSRFADPPLACALFQRNLETARLLLAAGADPRTVCHGAVSPLHIAIREKLIEAIPLLLWYGADPNQRPKHGVSPLMQAARTGNADMIGALLERGAVDQNQQALRFALRQLEDPSGAESAGRRPAANGCRSDWRGIVALFQQAADPAGRHEPVNRRRHRASAVRSRPPGRFGIRPLLRQAAEAGCGFAVIAVKAPLRAVAGALAALRQPERWLRHVPLRPLTAVRPGSSRAIALLQVYGPWTILLQSGLYDWNEPGGLAVDDAGRLAAQLKTRAVVLVRNGAGATEYAAYAGRRLLQELQWPEGKPIIVCRSRRAQAPRKNEAGDDYAERVFLRLGVDVPVVTAVCLKNRGWCCVDPGAARIIRRADLVVLRRPA